MRIRISGLHLRGWLFLHTDRCAPEDEEAVNGCIHEVVHTVCDDEIPCTEDACNPSSENANDQGCVNEVNNEVCNDDIDCTEDKCSPFRSIVAHFIIHFIHTSL